MLLCRSAIELLLLLLTLTQELPRPQRGYLRAALTGLLFIYDMLIINSTNGDILLTLSLSSLSPGHCCILLPHSLSTSTVRYYCECLCHFPEIVDDSLFFVYVILSIHMS